MKGQKKNLERKLDYLLRNLNGNEIVKKKRDLEKNSEIKCKRL